MSKGSSPFKFQPNAATDRTPSIKLTNLSSKDKGASPSVMMDDPSSLNDDLLSVNSSANRTDRFMFLSGRLSADSTSMRRSFDSSSVWGKQGRLYAPGSEIHSGSMEYSPLGNNSVYELVMNTRRKNWLRHPTTEDIPPVVLSKNDIDDSWRQSTEAYVSSIGDSYETFERTNNLEAIKGLGRLQLDELDGNEKMSTSKTDVNSDPFVEKEGYGSLAGVPEFYFDDKFKLDDARAFRKVIDDVDLQMEGLQSESPTDREAFYQEIQERLTQYLDCIEGLLVSEISKSSNSFFFALEDVDKIENQAAGAIKKLSELSNALEKVDKERVQSRIATLQKMIKRKNVEKLEQGLLQAKLVVEHVEKCKQLLSDGNLDDCLNMIDHVKNLLKGDDNTDKHVQELTQKWPYKLSDLRSARAFSAIEEYLANVVIEIGGKYTLTLCSILTEDIKQTYSSEQELEVFHIRKVSSGTNSKDSTKDAGLITSIKGTILKLVQCNELASAFRFYDEKLIAELKSIIKDFLPKEQEIQEDSADKSTDSKTMGNGSKLTRLIRALTPLEFQDMLVKIFVRETEAIRRLSRHQKILLDVGLGAIAEGSNSSDSTTEIVMQLDINPAIHEGIRTVQLRMGKIIAVRRDLNSKLGYDDFLKLCSICFWFDRECESLTGEFLTKYLQDVMAMQIKNYTTAFNSQNLQTLRSGIDQEKWTPFIVDRSLQRDVNDIVSCADITPSSWTDVMNLGERVSTTTEAETEQEAHKGHKKSVVVNDKTFVASNALLVTIGMLKGILVLAVNLPSQSLSVCEKMCYDLMMYFNGRAMASVSTGPDSAPSTKIGKNLSILAESLDCLAELASVVQSIFQRLGNSSKDFTPLPSSAYSQLMQNFQTSSDKLYQAHAPPPPV